MQGQAGSGWKDGIGSQGSPEVGAGCRVGLTAFPLGKGWYRFSDPMWMANGENLLLRSPHPPGGRGDVPPARGPHSGHLTDKKSGSSEVVQHRHTLNPLQRPVRAFESYMWWGKAAPVHPPGWTRAQGRRKGLGWESRGC